MRLRVVFPTRKTATFFSSSIKPLLCVMNICPSTCSNLFHASTSHKRGVLIMKMFTTHSSRTPHLTTSLLHLAFNWLMKMKVLYPCQLRYRLLVADRSRIPRNECSNGTSVDTQRNVHDRTYAFFVSGQYTNLIFANFEKSLFSMMTIPCHHRNFIQPMLPQKTLQMVVMTMQTLTNMSSASGAFFLS